jgi:putative copper export protein
MPGTSPTRAVRRPLHPFLVLILALVGGVFALGANLAHAQSEVDDEVSPLESSTPAVNAVLDAPPTQLQLTFTESFAAGITADEVGMAISCGGTPLGLGPRALGPDGRTILAPITQIAPGGPCAVSWRLPSGVVGTFEFTVRGSFAPTTVPGAPTTAPPTTTPGNGATTIVVDPADVSENVVIPGGTLLALARWLAVLGLVAVLGTVVLISLAWPEGIEYPDAVRFLRNAYFLALLGMLATAWQTTAELTGRSSTSALSPVSWAELLDDPTGRPVFARLVLVVLMGWVVARPVRAVDPTTQLASIALPVLAVATYGFSRTGIDNATTVYPAAVIHAVAMAVWLGGLAVTARVVLAKPGDDDLVYALRGYAKLATPAMLIAIVSGVVLSQRLVDGELWSTRHGRWIVLKVVLVGFTAYLGLMARRRWRRRLARAEVLEQRLARPMRRALSSELLMGVLIVGVTVGLAASRPAAVQPVSPATGYAFDTTLATEGFGVRLSMTPLIAGPQALRIEVLEPEQLESLRITLQPTDVPTSPGWAIDVPLQNDGAAVLRLAQGWRLEVPGVWSVDITARGRTGLLPTLSTSVVIADPLAD